MRYSILAIVLVVLPLLVLAGCGDSGGGGPDIWEKAGTQAGEEERESVSEDTGSDLYASLSGAYAEPGNSFELVILYGDGTYVMGDVSDFTYGDYSADRDAMTIDMGKQGTWTIGSAFSYIADETGNAWAKVLEDVLKGTDDGTIDEDIAADGMARSYYEMEDIFTQDELDELDREAERDLEEDLEDYAKERKSGRPNYTYADVAATYGSDSSEFQVTLEVDGTFESGYGLMYTHGLYAIQGDQIYFYEEPEKESGPDLFTPPDCGSSVVITRSGACFLDERGNTWRRELKREYEDWSAF